MSSLLSLRHNNHERPSHSHIHAQLLFGVSGLLESEIVGHSSQVKRQPQAVVTSDAHIDRHAAHPLPVADLARLA